MNRISRRLAFTFISQIVFVLVALAIGTIIFLVYVGLQLESKPETQHVTSRSNSTLRQTFSIENGHVSLDANKISDIEKREEWLQIIDAHGNMLASSKLPSDVPTHYEAGQLIAFWQKSIPFPYELIISQEEKGGQTYFVVVGQKRPARQLAEKLPIEWDGKRLSQQGERLLEETHGTLAIYSANGEILQQYGNVENPQAKLSLDHLLGDEADQLRNNGSQYIHFDAEKQQTWVIEVPFAAVKVGEGKHNTYLGKAFLLYGVALILFIIATAFWYGKRFGQPVLYIVNFIQRLADGNYHEQEVKKKDKSLNRRGKKKRSFRLFREINDSLNELNQQLKQNEKLRKQIEQTREEWIVGVSHDLKTPLSSINGYAHVLESAPYNWSQEEFQQIGKTLREKSTFMSELIDDLSLTYRLKNNALPMVRQTQEVNEVIRRAVIHFINDPQFTSYDISFHASDEPISYPLDMKWFTRIIDNMISNAIKHNPTNTKIAIIVQKESDHYFTVRIQDNGIGMDSSTLDQLFERYYRGTNSEENTSGSGLGMSIAKQLTVAHGGEIAASSTPGEGTVIVLKFYS
ncbi:sensor histidine kinase [Lysinibacillus fusiformis]|uniref:histidine kinase n=1 Tax=Lysinibacillus fusiformis TaxID=28031 RepID=A0A1H9MHP7_9BACI|nr:HAMP domain-containing sensor histidine kinase [Lysinibacillus fusiformis]SCY62059.1 His Kinase A (phospho-acceptor) domain-containing protein [Lysinibacillus fusiformis]SEN97452.1 His Kinase A (phospho-acceptor) domain-containing protein [Lysinibacillus fusiformis]SER23178.1 His Kinase A (phospho-acceptor) domain-containing protein [Lysinibacillus fusiformis]